MKIVTVPASATLLAAFVLGLAPACLNAGSPAISWPQIGAKAGANYQGDGLTVVATAQGARLRCVFQRLEGEATCEGLWLTSSAGNGGPNRFRVVAAAVGRKQVPAERGASESGSLESCLSASDCETARLPQTGTVAIDGQTVRFTRPGIVEEYSVSMDGVRQDFLMMERPAGAGEMAVRLAVTGARVEPVASGARLVLDNSGRKLAYSRLRAADATGREVSARMMVESNSTLVVVVNDANAIYPVRIDPTFSDANWSSMGGFPGANSAVSAVAVDGAGNVYIAGDFTAVGDTVVNHLAKWDGSSWSALGSGTDGVVSALAQSGRDLYAGGQFTTAGGIAATNIAKWNGSGWSPLGTGLTAPAAYLGVFALAVIGSNVYAGGTFTTAGGIAVNHIAKWDGSGWSGLGSGVSAAFSIFHATGVYALAVSGGVLYVGGAFDAAGGIGATNIAAWNGNSWSALGSGTDVDGQIYALAVSGSNVYAGGTFTMAGGIAATNIARWDGSSWSALGSRAEVEVHALATSGSDLYAGGFFTMAGNDAYIARWDGSSWSALTPGVSGTLGQDSPAVYALAVSGSNVYVGGAYRAAGETTAYGIAKWGGGNWSAMGSGMNGPVYALAGSDSNVYVGGPFTKIGGIAANHIAKWDGRNWSALGSGVDDYVYALAVWGSDVYVGGSFATAGGMPAANIAKWDGSSWSALGSGVDGGVAALVLSGSDLYVGGGFTTAGGRTVNCIARWDGSSWSPMGTGMSGTPDAPWVEALAVSGGDVYVGGSFATAGDIPAANIAIWDGNSWSALGSGTSDVVWALAVSDTGDVYAGGQFFSAGGVDVGYVARWDGNSWWAVDSGIPGEFYYSGAFVRALAISGSDLYMGGAYFTMPDGSPGTNIVKWDGSNWSPLGSGVNGDVYALAVIGNDLYAGGSFSTAGGKVSQSIARAYLLALPTLSVSPTSNPVGGILVSWPSADTDDFILQQTGSLNVPASWVSNTATITDDGTTKSVVLPATNSAQFFRLRRP